MCPKTGAELQHRGVEPARATLRVPTPQILPWWLTLMLKTRSLVQREPPVPWLKAGRSLRGAVCRPLRGGGDAGEERGQFCW